MAWKCVAIAAAFALVPMAANAQNWPANPDCKGPAPAAPTQTLSSAAKPADLGAAALPLGRPVLVALHSTTEMVYAMPLGKPGSDAAHGGLLSVTVPQALTYQISLGSGGWINVVKDGVAVASTTHTHGEACSLFRKMVNFPLQPGRYVIQISANPADSVAVMIGKAP